MKNKINIEIPADLAHLGILALAGTLDTIRQGEQAGILTCPEATMDTLEFLKHELTSAIVEQLTQEEIDKLCNKQK